MSAAPGGEGVPLPRGTYDVDLRIGVPRAQLVDWKISCAGGVEQAGTVGQAFDDYREQRLAQLTREREQQAKLHAQVMVAPPVGSPPGPRPVVVGATVVVGPTGPVVVRAPVVRTPGGRGGVRVEPTAYEAGEPGANGEREPGASEPSAEVVVPPVTELPPGDLGHGVYPARVRLVTPGDGVCAITALADDPTVTAFYSITRVRDLGVEAAERKQALYVGAASTRARMTDHLIGYGADPHAKQRRLEAAARARAEAEVKRGAELAARRAREVEVNRERAAIRDEQRRVREAEQARLRLDREAREEVAWAAREEREQLRLEEQAALQWERETPGRARLDLELHQKEVSIAWRLTLIAWLVGECNADPDRRGRIARARAEREREARLRLELRLEIERRERERLIRIRMEQDRLELERTREADRIAREERERKQRERDEAARLREQQRTARLEAERAERDNQLAIEQARREREARELVELTARRTGEARRVRATMVTTLIGFGAKLRPPMPELRIETPGPAPFDGAVWAAGRWEWNSIRVEWQWRGGGWRDTTRFGATGGEAVVHTDTVVVDPSPTVVVSPPSPAVIVAPAPTVVTPGVVIEVGGARPRPTYRPEPRPARPTYQPRPSNSDDKYRPRPSASRRDRKDDDRKR